MILGGFKVLKKEATKADALFLIIFMLIIFLLGMFLEAECHMFYNHLTADNAAAENTASKIVTPTTFGVQDSDWCYFVDDETQEVYVVFKAGYPNIGIMPAQNTDGTAVTFDQIDGQKRITGDISTLRQKFIEYTSEPYYIHSVLKNRIHNND